MTFSTYASRAVLLWALAFYLRIAVTQAQDRTCYWPDGSSTTEAIPCSGGDSQCCMNGDGCLSNGLCYSGYDGVLYRGACTVKGGFGNKAQCPSMCDKLEPKGRAFVFKCTWSQAHGWPYWCGKWLENPAYICNSEGANGTFIQWQRATVSNVVPSPRPTSIVSTITRSVTTTSTSTSTQNICPTSEASGQKPDFHWRFYNDFGCNRYANPADTWPTNGSPSGDGMLGRCYSSPSGTTWKGLELDTLFKSSQVWGVATFCGANCQGVSSIKQQDTYCFSPTPECSISSFKVIAT